MTTIFSVLQPDGSKIDIKAETAPNPRVHRLDEYKPANHYIEKVDIKFFLHETSTRVISTLTIKTRKCSDLVLNGEDMTVNKIVLCSGGSRKLCRFCPSIKFGHTVCDDKEDPKYGLDAEEHLLVIPETYISGSDTICLTSDVTINPTANLRFTGLYKSGTLFSTQCEAEGFRRITFFIDRPDVMSRYQVALIAPKKKCSVLLSNGNCDSTSMYGGVSYTLEDYYSDVDCLVVNCREEIDLNAFENFKSESDSLCVARFSDPMPKPCYLFAAVVGNLNGITDTFKTMSNRSVTIRIFAEGEDSKKLSWALIAVKQAMAWDEKTFGLEYDLDSFSIVCVKDFVMGAMENKGLNIFNTALLLTDFNTSTDMEYQRVLNVIGHEYFHNWTGNRVTCRDWFQLTLKEGLTVYRDQEFTKSVTDDTCKRVEDVLDIKSRQFAEDSGPMSHPIQPSTYEVIDNFYTSTVYNKGAEVIRMYETLLGRDGFRRGLDLYFKRHDGQAVTCQDFLKAMADANSRDLTDFGRWYSQRGTPHIKVSYAFIAESSTFIIYYKQLFPSDTALVVPIKFGLIGKTSKIDLLNDSVLEFNDFEKTIEIPDIREDAFPSFLRDFSAPIRLTVEHKDPYEYYCFMMSNDSNGFNRWDAAQRLASSIILDRVAQMTKPNFTRFSALPILFTNSFLSCLKQPTANPSALARTLVLPEMGCLEAETEGIVVHEHLHLATETVRYELALMFEKEIAEVYEECSELIRKRESYLYDEFKNDQSLYEGKVRCLDHLIVGARRLRNACMYYMCAPPPDSENIPTNPYVQKVCRLAYDHIQSFGKTSMTDRLMAFKLICCLESDLSKKAVSEFFEDAADDALMLDKWFSVQALSTLQSTIENVKALMQHPLFTPTNPNRLRSLIFAFARNSHLFNHISGEGYSLIADTALMLDSFNPQMASRTCSFLLHYRKLDETRCALAKAQLIRIRDTPSLSNDIREVVNKALE